MEGVLKAVENAFAEPLKQMSARCDDLHKENEALRAKHEVLQVSLTALQAADNALQADFKASQADIEALRSDYKALLARCDALQKESENSQKKTRNDLGDLQHSFAATDGHVEQLGEDVHIIKQQQNARRLKDYRRQRVIDIIADAFASEGHRAQGTSGADHPAPQSIPGSDHSPRSPQQRTFSQSPQSAMEVDCLSASPGTFHAESEAPRDIETPQTQSYTISGVKRTASQLVEHKSSQILQRKRAKSNLKKADGAHSSIVPRPRALAAHVHMEFSPASHLHLQELEGGMPAAELFESIGRLSQGSISQQETLDMSPPAAPRRTARDAKKRQAPGMVDSGTMVLR